MTDLISLLDFLQRRYPDSSKTTLRKMLQNDRVTVNGVIERVGSRQISPGDKVASGNDAERRTLDKRVSILFEDDDLLVINKAAGILSVPSSHDRSESVEEILNRYLRGSIHDIRVQHVHRLDRDSSGLLVFAKSSWIHERMQELFAAHEIDRLYVAIVHGKLATPRGSFRSTLAEDRTGKMRSIADASEGKQAVTHYTVRAAGEKFSMLDVTLETGRRNQIRVHFSEAGHPLIGDDMYGKGLEDPLGRLALHAKLLGFVHPRTGKKQRFDSPVPQAFTHLQL